MTETVLRKCYKKIKFSDGTTMDEHRYIMEQSIGHKLRKNQVVHHVNGDIHDNRLDNLEVMTRRKHAQLHLTGRTLPEEQRAKMSAARQGKPHITARTISDDQIRLALYMYGSGQKKREIESQCGLSMGTIYKMFQGLYARCFDFETEIKQSIASRQSILS